MKSKIIEAAILAAVLATATFGQVTAYNAVPSPLPPNYPSLGFQATSSKEFGDEVTLVPGTPRTLGFATVGMSSWSKYSNYPTMSPTGYLHPITFAVYADASGAAAHAPIATVTQTFLIPWRPEHDPSCPGDAWKAGNGNCYNGFAFTITFDLRHAGPGASTVQLPNTVIFGVAFNSNTWGYNPIGAPGPYESLNLGLNVLAPTTGVDVDPDAVFWNTSYAPFYTDGGAGGVGIFRRDTNWAPYTPTVQLLTFGFPETADSCKNGGWKNVVRTNFTPFSNQGDCVSYVQNGK